MFQTTTHHKFWIFNDESELEERRRTANHSFVADQARKQNIAEPEQYFLNADEEKALVTYYLTVLKDFCRKFNPPMPKPVTSTAVQYMKRFYLNNSVIEHQPKNIMVTCIYLAAKIEEFNVTMEQFVANIRGDRQRASDVVLKNELLLLHALKYHLTIWHPFRPIEGFLIDIKTRYPACQNPDKYRPAIDEFIDKAYSTDILFLLSPNKLALLAILAAAEAFGDNLDEYLYILFDGKTAEIDSIKRWAEKMEHAFARIETPSKETIKMIENKLSQCQVTVKVESDNFDSSDEDMDSSDTTPFESYSQHLTKQEEFESKLLER